MGLIGQLRDAVGKLNPAEVQSLADRPVHLRLRASSEPDYEQLFQWLLPPSLSDERRRAAATVLHLAGEESTVVPDLTVVCGSTAAQPGEFRLIPGEERTAVRAILDARPDLEIPLARQFPAFHHEVTARQITRSSLENASFAVATALPNIAPFLGFLWTPGEFASDTAFLTLNQIRMIFLLAAASDRRVGYREQKSEIASIVTGAFGWRAVARTLAGKIPAGGGIIPKAAIAYAGTWVVGKSVERLYRFGFGYTQAERRAAYYEAFEKGRDIAASLIDRFRSAAPVRQPGKGTGDHV